MRAPFAESHDRPMRSAAANQRLVLAAMVCAVAMTFIDRTIVAIAIPNIQKELSLTATCSKWVIDGYQLSLSALFAFGGRLADVLGRRSVVPGRARDRRGG